MCHALRNNTIIEGTPVLNSNGKRNTVSQVDRLYASNQKWLACSGISGQLDEYQNISDKSLARIDHLLTISRHMTCAQRRVRLWK